MSPLGAIHVADLLRPTAAEGGKSLGCASSPPPELVPSVLRGRRRFCHETGGGEFSFVGSGSGGTPIPSSCERVPGSQQPPAKASFPSPSRRELPPAGISVSVFVVLHVCPSGEGAGGCWETPLRAPQQGSFVEASKGNGDPSDIGTRVSFREFFLPTANVAVLVFFYVNSM